MVMRAVMTLAAIHVVLFIGAYSSVLEITPKHGACVERVLRRGEEGSPRTVLFALPVGKTMFWLVA